jgi:hypothetical protein
MRANPGGLINPEETIGRDLLIRAIWRRLENQSVLLTSERRIGKTSVIRKMKQACPPEDFCVLRDIEGLHSPGEFIESIYADLEPVLTLAEKTKQKFFKALEALGGIQVKDVKLPTFQPHWKSLLTAVIADATEAHKGRLVFFWDEMPLFIYNVAKMCGEAEAMVLLDTLRSIRQSFPTVRMVFTGSVGMHQVVHRLRKAGYANAPTNDMAIMEVPALAPEDGKTLAIALIEGEGMKPLGKIEDIAMEISECSSNIPFYIHTLVARIHDESDEIDQQTVINHVGQLVTDPNDPADFGYYEKRIGTYYENNDAQVARTILDIVAGSTSPLNFKDIFNRINHSTGEYSEEQCRNIIETLTKDHYIQKLTNTTICFKHTIVEKWWRFARGS